MVISCICITNMIVRIYLSPIKIKNELILNKGYKIKKNKRPRLLSGQSAILKI
jgi:hypothetical protein